jgi:hypothetical protein
MSTRSEIIYDADYAAAYIMEEVMEDLRLRLIARECLRLHTAAPALQIISPQAQSSYVPTQRSPAAPFQTPVKKETAPRKCQIMKERCQAVAGILWEENPHMEIKEVVAHPHMKKYGYCGNHTQNYEDRTIHGWVKCMDPRPNDEKKTPFGKNQKEKPNPHPIE